MIDLTCHFLTGPDCGPVTFEESQSLCRAACDNEVRGFVFTPRWKADRQDPPLPLETCNEEIERLRAVLAPDIDLRLGFELQFSSELPALVDQYGGALALAGKRHLLISLPANTIPGNAGNVWSELLGRQFRIIISQPESRPALRRHPETIRSWIEKGIKLQINAASILGWHGRECRKVAFSYLESYVESSLVASNGHAGNGDAGAMKQAREELTKIFGERRARKWLHDLPAEILGSNVRAHAAVARPFAQRFSFLRHFIS